MQVEEESIIERDWTFAGASLVHGCVDRTHLPNDFTAASSLTLFDRKLKHFLLADHTLTLFPSCSVVLDVFTSVTLKSF